MKTKDDLQKRISQIGEEIAKIEVTLEQLTDERYECEKELINVERAERTAELLSSIFTITNDNAQFERLYRDTSTTPIMDRFAKSSKLFLVFSRLFWLSPGWKHVSLVIAKSRLGINYDYNGLVMTDLKKAAGECVSERSHSYTNPTSRLYPLYRELIAISQKKLVKGDIVPFERVCLLGGQTYSDQTGFGSEYHGEDLVYAGKEYGETTKFTIVGVIVED